MANTEQAFKNRPDFFQNLRQLQIYSLKAQNV